MKLSFLLTALISLLTYDIAFAQLDIPRPSPMSTVSQDVGLNNITIEYYRPGVKDRVIFGDLVPFGKLWRTGANAATKLTLKGDAKFEGKEVPAGEYSLLTIPGKEEWTIIINKDAKTNTSNYSQEKDQARFNVKPTTTAEKVETFTISITDIGMDNALVELLWENTKVSFKMETEVDSEVMEQIEKATAGVDPMVYYRSATYYYDTGKDLNKALEWMNKSLESRQTYWMLHTKAKIQAKMGDKKGAIATAEESKAAAVKDGNESYISLNDKLIAEVKKKK